MNSIKLLLATTSVLFVLIANTANASSMDNQKSKALEEYLTRCLFIGAVINPANLLATSAAIANAKANPSDPKSKILLTARVHPDTGKPIPWPFSLPFIIPSNLLIVMGMLQPKQTNRSIAFWQIINQSMNTGVNWANANKSGGEMSATELAFSYLVSVVSSCGLGMGVNRLAVRRQSALLRTLSPVIAVGGANVVNVGIMRGSELRNGISLSDQNGVDVGVSTAAAKQAIAHTMLSRNLIAAALLLCPPLTMNMLRRVPAIGRNKVLQQVLEGMTVIGFMVPAVPMGVAAFPQHERINISDIEEPLQSDLRRKGYNGDFSINRGL